jgi:SAM-dependent methyltransferase
VNVIQDSMNMKRNCAVCGSDQKDLIFQQRFTVPATNCVSLGYDVVVCQQCDFAYADNPPSQANLDAYYATGLKTAYHLGQRACKDPTQLETESDATLHANSVENIRRYARPGDRILDVGCGSGHLLSLLRARGYDNLHGIDPSLTCCRVASEHYGLSVTQGSLLDAVDIGQFDFAILNHVLEHVESLAIFVMRLHEVLRPDGRLYIEVPDVHQFGLCILPQGKVAWEFASDLFAQFTPEHVNFFSGVALRNLMLRLGFREVWLESQVSVMGVLASVWEKPRPDRDPDARACLEQYVRDSRQMLDEPSAVIDALVRSGEELLVWGAGLHTQRLLGYGHLAEAKIRAFVDSNPAYHGQCLAGRPIVAPEEVRHLPSLPILVSSRRLQDDIARQIRRSGFANRIVLLYSSRLGEGTDASPGTSI